MKITVTDWLFGIDGALFRAANRGTLEMAVELVGKGANVRVTSNRGVTPLHRAAQNGHREIVEFLLRHGAQPGAEADDGQTPISMAEANGHDKIAALLRAQAGDK